MAPERTAPLSGGRIAEELPSELQEDYKKHFPGTLGKIFRVQPSGTIVTEAYNHMDKDVYNFQFRPDDVLVMTYPKCGTTWTQEILWTMRNNPNLDSPKAQESLMTRSPFLEIDFLMFEHMKDAPNLFLPESGNFQFDPSRCLQVQIAESQTEPRVLKTHLPFSCFKPDLIDTCKVVFVMRHPKDAVLSYQHHCRLINGHGFVSTQDVFVKYFVEDLLVYGSYGNIVKEMMKHKSHPNLHIMHFEDMKTDITSELRKLDAFIGTKLTDAQLKNVEEHSRFSNMQKSDPTKQMPVGFFNEEVAKKDGGFMRKGQAGAWKGKLTQEQDALLDKYIVENFNYPEIKARYQ